MSDHAAEPALPAASADRDEYWQLARRPLNCLMFLAPLLAVYEIGVWRFGADGDRFRNGADYWMRAALRLAGLEYAWALPMFVIGYLILRQVAGRHRWQVSAPALLGMLAESLLFGICLIVLGELQELAFRRHLPSSFLSISLSNGGSLPQVVGYVGAGIYEEVLFRLCLFPLTYAVLRLLLLSRGPAILLSVIATSTLFAVAHYVGPAADAWSLYGFTFRALAGGFFAMLYVVRGFGVTVGTHAAYDLLVGILLPWVAVERG